MFFYVFSMFLLVFFLLLSIYFYLKIKLTKKTIWKKISFLYNKIYEILIFNYYNKNLKKRDLFREEIIDFYQNVVLNWKIFFKDQECKKFKSFILDYLEYDKEVVKTYDDINVYFDQVNNVEKAKINIIWSIIAIITVLFFIIYMNY